MNELRRHIMMQQGGGGGLPPEYQQVEWLQQSGGAYLSVPAIVPDPFEVELRGYAPTAMWAPRMIVGGLNYDWTFSIAYYYASLGMCFNSNNWVNYSYANYEFPRGSSVGNFWFVLYANSLEYYSSIFREDTEELNVGGCPSGAFPKITPINIFSSTEYAGFKMAYVKLRGVFNLIPCYRKSDSEPGMYDVINNVFYTNVGSGSFVVGSDIN